MQMKMQNLKPNKNFLFTLISVGMFFVFSFSQANAYTETHYVTQDGKGSKNGRSMANAWSVAQFNTSGNWSSAKAVDNKIGPDDVVYFFGTITTRLDLKGSGIAGNPITLDGYETGDCNPIANGSCSGATVTGGLENTQPNHYLIFQDFNIKKERWTFLKRVSESTNLKWLRNNWDDSNTNHLTASAWLGGPVGFYWWFEGNRFGNYALTSDPPGGVNFGEVHHLVLRGNLFTGHNGIAQSSNMIEFHQCVNVLVEYNYVDCTINQGNSGNLSFKEHGNQNAIVRFNKFRTIKEAALGFGWPTTEHIFVYGNYFYQDAPSESHTIGLMIHDGATKVNIWSNIFAGHNNPGLAMWYRTKSIENVKIYNNTFYNNATASENAIDRAGLSIGDGGATGIIVKNNIFSNNKPTAPDRRQINNQIGTNLTLEHNTYYHSGGAPTVYHLSGDRTISTLQINYGREEDLPAGVVANPGLNENLTLNGTHINNGANLSGLAGSLTIHGTTYNMYWQTALHPSTDWSGQPSPAKIKTADQNSHGSGWERGAYAYTSSPTSLPGDFNSDNEVNTLDYEIMKREFLKTGTNLKSDMNKDGKVNTLDYELFRREFGKKK